MGAHTGDQRESWRKPQSGVGVVAVHVMERHCLNDSPVQILSRLLDPHHTEFIPGPAVEMKSSVFGRELFG